MHIPRQTYGIKNAGAGPKNPSKISPGWLFGLAYDQHSACWSGRGGSSWPLYGLLQMPLPSSSSPSPSCSHACSILLKQYFHCWWGGFGWALYSTLNIFSFSSKYWEIHLPTLLPLILLRFRPPLLPRQISATASLASLPPVLPLQPDFQSATRVIFHKHRCDLPTVWKTYFKGVTPKMQTPRPYFRLTDSISGSRVPETCIFVSSSSDYDAVVDWIVQKIFTPSSRPPCTEILPCLVVRGLGLCDFLGQWDVTGTGA